MYRPDLIAALVFCVLPFLISAFLPTNLTARSSFALTAGDKIPPDPYVALVDKLEFTFQNYRGPYMVERNVVGQQFDSLWTFSRDCIFVSDFNWYPNNKYEYDSQGVKLTFWGDHQDPMTYSDVDNALLGIWHFVNLWHENEEWVPTFDIMFLPDLGAPIYGYLQANPQPGA